MKKKWKCPTITSIASVRKLTMGGTEIRSEQNCSSSSSQHQRPSSCPWKIKRDDNISLELLYYSKEIIGDTMPRKPRIT